MRKLTAKTGKARACLQRAGSAPPKQGVVVSAFGRGAFTAHQLRRIGFEVTLLDLTAFFPALSACEREGPFGVFTPSHLSGLQKRYLLGDNYYPASKGFSCLSSQGLLEFQGPLSSFFLKTRKDFQLCYSVLSSCQSGKKKAEWEKSLGQQHLLRFLARWASVYMESSKSLKNLSPFFADYFLRESSQRHFEELKKSLQAEGVERFAVSAENTKNRKARGSLKFTKKYIQLKIGEWEKSADFLVYTLSGPETRRIFPTLLPLLFPRWEEPVKIWRRFSLSWDPGRFKNIIPDLLWIILEDDEKESTGEDKIFSLKKHPADRSRLDLWMLCPYTGRFNTDLRFLEPALARLNGLFPGFSLQGVQEQPDLNQEYFVLYKNSFKKKKVPPHLFHIGPESCGKMDACSLMQESESALQKIQKQFL